MMTMST